MKGGQAKASAARLTLSAPRLTRGGGDWRTIDELKFQKIISYLIQAKTILETVRTIDERNLS